METASIVHQVNAIEDWLIGIRREFHQHPELGLEEFWTSAKIAAMLQEMDIPYQHRVAGTGIVGMIRGKTPGRTVALRADMDGLPIHEQTGLDYASMNSGKMHACGHDAHIAILLGAAKVLNELRPQLAGNIKLLFQPAEESVGGAKSMIAAGCLENPQVDYVLGLHVTPAAEAGQILLRQGQLTAASDDVRISVQGRSAHAAYPEEGVDAIVIAAHILIALQSVVSRCISPLKSGVVTIGKIAGGLKAERERIH